MDINQIINEIKNKCRVANHPEIIADIDLLIKSGATGGEITAMVGKYLFDLKKKPNIYSVIKEEIEDYLRYCNANGMIIS